MRIVVFGMPIVISLVVVMSIIVGSNIATSFPTFAFATVSEQQFTAKLFGDMEVPSIETNATGIAEFRPILNDDIIAYSLNVTDIDQVTMAHIHQGKEGENGPVVVTLIRFKTLTPTGPVNGLLAQGNLTSADLEGPLAGKQLSDLLSAMHSMGVYVDIHTAQYPDGEIRGQISNSTSGMMMK
jgi:CHRD domain-containing protein